MEVKLLWDLCCYLKYVGSAENVFDDVFKMFWKYEKQVAVPSKVLIRFKD